MNQLLFNVHEMVLFVTVIEALFLAGGVLLIPRVRRQSHGLLAALLASSAVILAATLVVWNPSLQVGFFANSVSVPALLTLALLLQGPLLYGVMISFTRPLIIASWPVLLHLTPAVLGVALVVGMGISVTDWLPWNWQYLAKPKQQTVLVVWAAFKCSPLLYALLCCHAEYRLRRQLYQRYANLPQLELRWAELLLGGFTLHWLWIFTAYWLSGYVSAPVNNLMGLISNYVMVMLINGLFVFALFSGRKVLSPPEVGAPPTVAAQVEQVEDKLAMIARAIAVDKLHLDPHINLERFAELCDLKPRELSVLINSYHRKSFFEFINYYRVEEVKRLLTTDHNMIILEAALAAGFNSQSAFQRFFKRLVGITPTEYRRRHRTQPIA